MRSDVKNAPPATKASSAGRRLLFYWLPVALLCGALFWQSSFPSVQTPSLFPIQDKLLHMTAYGLLDWLFARALAREKPELSISALKWAAIGFACFYGLTDEIHQAFVPSRNADVWDFAADGAGAFLGALLYIRGRQAWR